MSRLLSTAAIVLLTTIGSLTLIIAMPGCNNRSRPSQPDAGPQAAGTAVKTPAAPTTTVTRQEAALVSKTETPPGEIIVDLGNGVKLEMVSIAAGELMMGSPDSDTNASSDEKPRHQVQITKPFYLGKYLVTQEQWQAVMGTNPSSVKGPNNPVENVSWEDCQQFCDVLNKKSHAGGGKFQLPTEAQWEYACRAGSTTRYCFGDEESRLGEYAWFSENSLLQTHPVGEKKPNAWKLYDMHGNVWEWCQDWYDRGYYAHSPTDDPTGPATGPGHVFRGGAWDYPANCCRSAHRSDGRPGFRDYLMGLRVSLRGT